MVMPPILAAPFPCNKQIGWRSWYSGGKDGFQNDIDAWTDPQNRMVIGWESVRVMDRDGVHAVEDTDKLKLVVPADFAWQPQDLVDIPGRGSYQIVGLDDSTEGFHNWRPGIVLRLELGSG